MAEGGNADTNETKERKWKRFLSSLQRSTTKKVIENEPKNWTPCLAQKVALKLQKSDVKKSASNWTIKMFEKYFDFNSTVHQVPNLESDFNSTVQQNLKCEIEDLKAAIIKDYKRRERTLGIVDVDQLKPVVNECTMRVLFDTIIFDLCRKADCKIEVEFTVEGDYWPPCRFDYRIKYKDHAIGCVEAKCTDGLSYESIVQAVLQLCVLQAELAEKGSTKPLPPLFSILTDGTEYILIQLKNNQDEVTRPLVFENKLGKLFVHRLKTVEEIVNWLTPTFLHLTSELKSSFDSFLK